MFKLFRISARVEELDMAFKQLQHEFKFMKDEFEKLEIKSLESRKIYGKKLKQFVEKDDNTSKDNVFLLG
jgi:hypothetical protein